MFYKVKKLFFLLTILFFFFWPGKAIADENFKTDYLTTYSFGTDGTTHVSLDVTLSNTTSDYYASSYSVSVGFTDVQNVRVTDSLGTYTPDVNKNDSGAKITVDFRKNALGLNAKQKFNLSFDTNQIAQNNGTTWEVNIPGISKQNDFNSFTATVIAPSSFGNPSYVKPNVGKINGNSLVFSKEDLGDSGISIGYGSSQIYNFSLTYHLQNKNLFPVNYEIALPLDTNYQKVFINSISPLPKNVVIDKDGNYIALINVPPGKKVTAKVSGNAKVNLSPSKEYLTADQIKTYTSPRDYWQSNNPDIMVLAQKLKTPKAIYDYVVDNLNYDFSRVTKNQTRLGATKVLANKESAVCLEFTDLFIALARSAGIPAREVNGFANTQNSRERPLSLVKDILHAWPEYYDFSRQEWIMVDPTWANTTRGVDYFNVLDFDHFAFVIQGNSSSYPVPAGGYKEASDEGEKDVDVRIQKDIPQEIDTSQIRATLPDKIIAGVPAASVIRVQNTGNTSLESSDLTFSSSFENTKYLTNEIPPFGYQDVSVKLSEVPFLTNKTDIVKIQFGKNKLEKKVKIIPFFFDRIFLIGGIIFVTSTLTLSVFAIRSRNLSVQK